MAPTSKVGILIQGKNDSQGAFSSAEKSMLALRKVASAGGGLLAGAALTLGAGQLGELTWVMGRASAESMRLSDSFDMLSRQAGEAPDAMLAAMRRASRGTIDDTSLITDANRAMLLGVADTAEEMASLLEVAGARGKAMGLSMRQSVRRHRHRPRAW